MRDTFDFEGMSKRIVTDKLDSSIRTYITELGCCPVNQHEQSSSSESPFCDPTLSIVVFIRVCSRRLFVVEMHTAIIAFFYVVVVAICLL